MNPSGGKVPVTGPEVSQSVEPAEVALLREKPGLCAGCRHAEVRRSKRSAFLRCGRAAEDTRFPRYPGLPVLQCAGFETPAAAAKEPGNLAPIG